MRIGIFTDSYPPYTNGVSTSILMLQRALEKKGHTVYVVTVNPQNMHYKFEDEDKIIRIPGIPTGIYDYRLTGMYPIRSVKKIKSWNLDIIHSHTEFGIGTFARLISIEFNIPLVHTYHTMYEDYIESITRGYFDKSSKKIVEYITKFFCDKTCTELIVPTKKTYDLFKQKYKYDRDIYIIPTGIETERFSRDRYTKSELDYIRSKHQINKDDFVILYLGRLGKEKNIEFIVDVYSSIVKKEHHTKLLLVGDGPDEEYLKKKVSNIGINKNVIFAGKVPYEDAPKYYNISNVFITASHFETQGLTVVEALASQLPAVCINDESFSGTIINDYNGFIFNTEEECIECILKIKNNKNLEKRLKNGAISSAQMHSSKYFADQVINIYEKAIKEGNKDVKSKIINFFRRRSNKWKK